MALHYATITVAQVSSIVVCMSTIAEGVPLAGHDECSFDAVNVAIH
jgi:hypothetical protein